MYLAVEPKKDSKATEAVLSDKSVSLSGFFSIYDANVEITKALIINETKRETALSILLYMIASFIYSLFFISSLRVRTSAECK